MHVSDTALLEVVRSPRRLEAKPCRVRLETAAGPRG